MKAKSSMLLRQKLRSLHQYESQPNPKFFSICKAFLCCLEKNMPEVKVTVYMLTGSKLFQILALCSATVDLSQILFKEITKEKRLHKYHPTTLNKPGKDPASHSNGNSTTSQDYERFYKPPSVGEGLNPDVLYPSELHISRITLPCLSSRIY